jgi:cytochrome c peroxidase
MSTKRYRATPLRALPHPPYYHNGEFVTLMEAVKA